MRRAIYCSFCGKRHNEVDVMVAGPTVFICDQCVEVSVDVIATARAKARQGLLKVLSLTAGVG